MSYIRNIDNLGRIVIPKEIRDNLRLKNNDSIELTVKNKSIIIKKYSCLDKIEDISKNITEVINSFVHHNIVITNRDKVISYVGKSKYNLINKEISNTVEKAINRRQQIYENNKKDLDITQIDKFNCQYIIDSILYKGEVAGLLIVFDEEENITKEDYQTVKIITHILNKYLED